MSLVQYGVTNDSRVILSVKDVDSNATVATSSATSTAAAATATAASCSKPPELNSELMTLLLRHFTPADAERVAEEFKQVGTYLDLNSIGSRVRSPGHCVQARLSGFETFALLSAQSASVRGRS